MKKYTIRTFRLKKNEIIITCVWQIDRKSWGMILAFSYAE